jgi:hypothetical protein
MNKKITLKDYFLIWLATIVIFIIIVISYNLFPSLGYRNGDSNISPILSMLLICDVITGVVAFIGMIITSITQNLSGSLLNKKTTTESSSSSGMINSFIVWVICCILFILAVISQNESLTYFNLLIVFIGSTSFLWYLYDFGKQHGVLKTFFMALFLVVIFSFVLIVSLNPKILNDFSSGFGVKNNRQNELIECYVEGRKIMATRTDCQELSIPKPQPTQAPIIIQQQQQRQIYIPPPPPLIKNTYTNCQWIGNQMYCNSNSF